MPCGLADRRRRIFKIMQNQMQGHQIEALFQPGLIDIATPGLHVRDIGLYQPVARQGQHVAAGIDADTPRDMRGEELQNAPGPGAHVEQRLRRVGKAQRQHRRLDFLFGDVHGANAVPLIGIGCKISRRSFAAPIKDGIEAAAVFGNCRIIRLQGAHHRRQKPRHPRIMVMAKVGPGPFLKTFQQTRFQKQFEMARNARLALIENLDEVGHRQFSPPQQRENAQPGLFPRSPQPRDALFETVIVGSGQGQNSRLGFATQKVIHKGANEGKHHRDGAMKATTPRQKAIVKALRDLIPRAPYADFEPIALASRAPHMRDLAPRDAAFLTTIAHIRHQHTEYDTLRDEGYDGDSARHFVMDDINEKLTEWGATRLLCDEVNA